MKKTSLSFICLVMAALAIMMIGVGAYAAQECVNTLEPNLRQDADNQPTGGANNQLQGQGAGVDIINGIFSAVDGVVAGISQRFYTSVAQNQNYRNAVHGLLVFYLAVYGVMLLFNMASHKTAEVVSRLFKIGIVWSIMINGWDFFNQYIGGPVLVTMNQIIANFIMAAGGAAGGDSIDATGALNPVSVSILAGPMTLIFSLRFVAAILALLSTGPFGWFFVLVVLWAMLEFILMLLAAIITYIKSIVGLSFLFGIAPIFFSFILFEQSKRIFLGWVNQVFGFFLLPVMLFAFLSFYVIMILGALETVLFPAGTDICHVIWLKFGIVDIWWWRFENAANQTGGDGNGTWQGPPPIGVMDILYLLLLTHMGKNLSRFIEQLARDISGGQGPGMVRSASVGNWFSNHIPGVGGRGIAGIASAGLDQLKYRGMNALDRTGVTKSVQNMFKRGNPTQAASSRPASPGTGTPTTGNPPPTGTPTFASAAGAPQPGATPAGNGAPTAADKAVNALPQAARSGAATLNPPTGSAPASPTGGVLTAAQERGAQILGGGGQTGGTAPTATPSANPAAAGATGPLPRGFTTSQSGLIVPGSSGSPASGSSGSPILTTSRGGGYGAFVNGGTGNGGKPDGGGTGSGGDS